MTHVSSFAPVADSSARVLILGSMPGVASLQAGQYYAHPRNAFWRLMGDLVGAAPSLSYPARLQRLQHAGIALWDVLQHCHRPGSLDADIATDSMIVNDFAGFLREHAGIDRVLFNGATADQCFRRRVLPALERATVTRLTLIRLPSTSPAHAALPYADKLAAWQQALSAVSSASMEVASSSKGKVPGLAAENARKRAETR